MEEQNGYHNPRMDRIEKALELLIADHEQFRQDHKQLLIAQVVQSDQIADLVKISASHSAKFAATAEQLEILGKRVDDLVSGIGSLISRIPPSALA